MSEAGLKEIISFGGIALLIIALVLIQLSRRKLTGVLAAFTALVAYISLIVGGLIVVFIVFSGPTQ